MVDPTSAADMSIPPTPNSPSPPSPSRSLWSTHIEPAEEATNESMEPNTEAEAMLGSPEVMQAMEEMSPCGSLLAPPDTPAKGCGSSPAKLGPTGDRKLRTSSTTRASLRKRSGALVPAWMVCNRGSARKWTKKQKLLHPTSLKDGAAQQDTTIALNWNVNAWTPDTPLEGPEEPDAEDLRKESQRRQGLRRIKSNKNMPLTRGLREQLGYTLPPEAELSATPMSAAPTTASAMVSGGYLLEGGDNGMLMPPHPYGGSHSSFPQPNFLPPPTPD